MPLNVENDRIGSRKSREPMLCSVIKPGGLDFPGANTSHDFKDRYETSRSSAFPSGGLGGSGEPLYAGRGRLCRLPVRTRGRSPKSFPLIRQIGRHLRMLHMFEKSSVHRRDFGLGASTMPACTNAGADSRIEGATINIQSDGKQTTLSKA